MRRIPRILCVFLIVYSTGALGLHAWDESGDHPEKPGAGAKYGDTLSFVFEDPAAKAGKGGEDKSPWIRLYPDGKDKEGKDASSTLNLLKWGRGASKLRPVEDKAPGLIMMQRGMRLQPKPEGGYEIRLYGEFNGVKSTVSEAQMRDLFSGKQVVLNIKTKVATTTGVSSYKVETDVRLRVSLEAGTLKVYQLVGDGYIEKSGNIVGFRSTEKFASPAFKLGDDKSQNEIFRGKSGTVPDLKLVN